MQKTICFLRTHKINEAIISEFTKMQNCGVDCAIILDNTNNIVDDDKKERLKELEFYGVKASCVLLYYEDYIKLGFYNFDNVAYNFWFNVDYAVYIAKSYFEGYDYYWSLEYDCFLNAPNYKDFFDFYKKDDADFIISHFRKESLNGSWWPSHDISWAYDEKENLHGCLFSNERYSARFLEHLYEKRKEFSNKFLKYNGKKAWLHPEVMSATEAVKNGFKVRNYTDDGHYVNVPGGGYENIINGKKVILIPGDINLNENRLFLKPDNKMYHPIKDDNTKSRDERI
ncbi:hypothetical protein, partial [Campylobacter avium]